MRATRDAGLCAAVHHDDPEWCKRLTFRDYIDKGRNDAMAYHESFARGYMYGHGMVAGLAASLYYARIAGVRLHVLHLGVMPVGAYEMIRHAKFELGQQVTAELECASMFHDARTDGEDRAIHLQLGLRSGRRVGRRATQYR